MEALFQNTSPRNLIFGENLMSRVFFCSRFHQRLRKSIKDLTCATNHKKMNFWKRSVKVLTSVESVLHHFAQCTEWFCWKILRNFFKSKLVRNSAFLRVNFQFLHEFYEYFHSFLKTSFCFKSFVVLNVYWLIGNLIGINGNLFDHLIGRMIISSLKV